MSVLEKSQDGRMAVSMMDKEEKTGPVCLPDNGDVFWEAILYGRVGDGRKGVSQNESALCLEVDGVGQEVHRPGIVDVLLLQILNDRRVVGRGLEAVGRLKDMPGIRKPIGICLQDAGGEQKREQKCLYDEVIIGVRTVSGAAF